MRILLTGASGQLGAYLIPRLIERGHDIIAWSGSGMGERDGIALNPINLTDRDLAWRALVDVSPDAIIHAAAVSAAEAVRLDPGKASAINVLATARIAEWCHRYDRRLVFTSTDLVFDGTRAWNREIDPAEPVLSYGRTKRQAEPSVLACARGVVARVSLLYGPSRCGRASFFDQAIAAMRGGHSRSFFEDEYRTPLYLGSAAEALIRLAEADVTGLYHVAGAERMSRFELMRRTAIRFGIDPDLVHPSRRPDAPLIEPRPADVSLDTTRLTSTFIDLPRPPVEEALRAN